MIVLKNISASKVIAKITWCRSLAGRTWRICRVNGSWKSRSWCSVRTYIPTQATCQPSLSHPFERPLFRATPQQLLLRGARTPSSFAARVHLAAENVSRSSVIAPQTAPNEIPCARRLRPKFSRKKLRSISLRVFAESQNPLEFLLHPLSGLLMGSTPICAGCCASSSRAGIKSFHRHRASAVSS
ncbi:hypothetical protein SAMN05414139_04653 [Burkholderia sp. D7]|nr:hypothetical protein SAMN05414139_04653 [Burkholderia sp. D7]